MLQGRNRNKIHSCNDEDTMFERHLDPTDIYILRGYGIEVFINNLDAPSSMVFDEDGNILISDSGKATGEPRILKSVNGQLETIAEDFVIPISGINYLMVCYTSLIEALSRKYIKMVQGKILLWAFQAMEIM